ncbi:hypothetical protein [Granulibacter bethesdensis]|nr:hypothetical protein [Granulibacter bethesdensis]
MADIPPPSIREQVIVSIFDILRTALPDVRVMRESRADPAVEDAPWLTLLDSGHQAGYDQSGLVTYTLSLGLDGGVAATSDGQLGPALNALYARIISAVMADPGLGGLATGIEESSLSTRQVTAGESTEPLIVFSLDLAVTFLTADGNPWAA